MSDYANMKMEVIEACRDLPDDKVIEQIQIRCHWINNVLNGWLYESVLADEVAKLREMLNARQAKLKRRV